MKSIYLGGSIVIVAAIWHFYGCFDHTKAIDITSAPAGVKILINHDITHPCLTPCTTRLPIEYVHDPFCFFICRKAPVFIDALPSQTGNCNQEVIWTQKSPSKMHFDIPASGKCDDVILGEISRARWSIQVMGLRTISTAKALVEAQKRGVKVEVILDKNNVPALQSAVDLLASAGILTWIDPYEVYGETFFIDSRLEARRLTDNQSVKLCWDCVNESKLMWHDKGLYAFPYGSPEPKAPILRKDAD